jgi:transcriptional regulator with XRE-family HTH domain
MVTRDPESNPAAFLGDELRRARVAGGFSSQDALAARLGFDRSVITKIEHGDRPPSADVLYAWCSACGLDADHFGRLAVLARRADGVIPAWFEGWLEAERGAHTLRIWSPLLIPGLLQTADYARTLFLAAGFNDDESAAMTDARLERQTILDHQESPLVTVVLDEAVLHRLIGDPIGMADQLEHLAGIAGLSNVSIHVLPATGANAGLSGGFYIASTDGQPDTLVLDSLEDQVTQNRSLVQRARVVFDLVRRDALPRIPSRDLILEASSTWKTR